MLFVGSQTVPEIGVQTDRQTNGKKTYIHAHALITIFRFRV